MIELIASLFNEGDPIKLEYGQKAQIVSGTILKIAGNSIAIKKFEGGIAGIKGNEIISFDTVDSPNQQNIEHAQEHSAKVEPIQVANILDNTENQTHTALVSVEPTIVSEKQKDGIVTDSAPSA